MFKFIVCVSLLLALVVADYDFQDSDFNELLFDDLTDDVDEDLLEPLRFRRGADNETDNKPDNKDCHRKKDKKEKEKDTYCCNGEKANPLALEAVKTVKKNCIAEIRGDSADDVSYDPLNCDGVQSMRQQIVCAVECMAREFNLITDSGELKRDALVNHTRRIVGENKWKADVLEDYVDKCLMDLMASTAGKSESKDVAKCNPAPLEFHHCIWKTLIEGCPVEAQIDSKKCRKIREHLAKGDISYADKSFKKHFKRPRH